MYLKTMSRAGSPASSSVPGGSAGRPAVAQQDPRKNKPVVAHPFKAELDLAEIDERRRPSTPWPGRGVELSRSQLIFRSRRMCYAGRCLLIAIHLVDDRPVPLYGEVVTSEYDGDGMYKTTLGLLPVPEEDAFRHWINAQQPRSAM
jgi:hypothetical protein